MAARVLLVRPALPVSAVLFHLPPSSTPFPSKSSAHPSPELNRLLCSRSSASESSPAGSARGSRFRAAGRCSNLGGKFPGKTVNWNLVDGLGNSRVRKIFSSMASGPSGAQTVSMEEEEAFKSQERITEHQLAAKKLPRVVEARTLVDKIVSGILSTISKKMAGFPVSSMVPFAAEEDGSILMCVSSLSSHTADLDANPNCSILIAKDLNDRTDIVITFVGEATEVPAEDEEKAKSAFLKKHPGAFWVDFADFKMVRIEPKRVRMVSGIMKAEAAISEFSGEEFKAAAIDPISQFAAPVAHHMNRDHADQTRMIVEHGVGIKVESAIIQDVDSFGFYVLSQFQGRTLKLRIPFPRMAENRKDVKTLLVEMLAASVPQEK